MPFTRLSLSSELSLAYQLCLKAVLPGLRGHSGIFACQPCTASAASPCFVTSHVLWRRWWSLAALSSHSMTWVTPWGCLWRLPWPLLICVPSTLARLQCVPDMDRLWDALGLAFNLVRDSSMSALWWMKQTVLENPIATKLPVLSDPAWQRLSETSQTSGPCNEFYVLTSNLCFWSERELGCLKITSLSQESNVSVCF